jgi:hypothetical protein
VTWLLRVDRLPANKACCLRRWAVAFPLPRRLDVPAVRAPEWFGPFRVAVQATCKHWQSRGPRATGSSSSCSGSALAVALATGLAVSILLLVKEPDAGNERVTMPSSFPRTGAALAGRRIRSQTASTFSVPTTGRCWAPSFSDGTGRAASWRPFFPRRNE